MKIRTGGLDRPRQSAVATNGADDGFVQARTLPEPEVQAPHRRYRPQAAAIPTEGTKGWLQDCPQGYTRFSAVGYRFFRNSRAPTARLRANDVPVDRGDFTGEPIHWAPPHPPEEEKMFIR